MNVGVILGDVPASVGPREHLRALFAQVEAAQRNGFTYLTIGQHFLYGDIRWLQPVPTLARLAAEVGTDIRLVTTVLLAPLYHPVMLAEELATLDIVTEGRLVVGVGLGYRPEEFAAFGIPMSERVGRMEECLEVVDRLWTEDEVTHHGRFFALEQVRPHLRPLQTPRPPLWIGAKSDAATRRAARLGDAWPITPQVPFDELAERVGVYAAERRRLGRPVGPLPLRRDVALGPDSDAALARFTAMAQDRQVAYAERGLPGLAAETLRADYARLASRYALVGTAADCVDRVRAVASTIPVDPLVVRAQWPGMDGDGVVAFLDELGRDFVPGVRSIPLMAADPEPARPA